LRVRRFNGYYEVIEKAGIQIPPERYISTVIKISIAVASLFVTVALIMFYIGFEPISIALIIITPIFVASLFIYPYLLKIHRSVEFRKNILTLFSLIGALSKSSNDIDYIMGVVAESVGGEMSAPFRIYLYNRIVLGMDTTEAIRRAASRCPYDELADAFISIADAIETTGNPSNVLEHLFEKSLVNKRGQLEKQMRRSMIIGEFYISLMVLFPMILIVMMVIFSMIGSGLFGLDPASLITLITYMTAPLSVMIYLMVSE